MTKVALVDDQALVRAGFSALLDAEDDIEVVGEAADGDEALRLLRRTRPDVVLMDVRMPVLDGLDATRRLRKAGCAVPILALTADVVAEQVDECLAAGCSAFVPKPADFDHLLQAIASARAMEAPVDRGRPRP